MIQRGFLLLVTSIICSCGNDCADFNDSSDAYHKEAKGVMIRNEKMFDTLSNIFKDFTSQTQSVIASDSFIEFSLKNEIVKEQIKDQFKRKIYFIKNNNSFQFYLYPIDLSGYNRIGDCAYFDGVFIYSMNLIPHSNSLNFKYYKLKENWYVRTSIASL